MGERSRRWGLTPRALSGALLGAVLYGVLSWVTKLAALRGSNGIELRPAIVIPIIIGFRFGPLAGFVAGCGGNLLGDWLNGESVDAHWALGNGVMGLFPGLAALRWRRFRSYGEIGRGVLVAGLGIVLGMGLAVVLDSWTRANTLAPQDHWQTAFFPVVKVNLLNALILVPILLFNLERLDLRALGWRHSGLLRRMLLAVLISAALPTAILGVFLLQDGAGHATTPTLPTSRLLLVALLSVLFSVANASLVAQSLLRPLLRLTQAARAMEQGQMTAEQVAELREAAGSDELALLSRRFGTMADEVVRRELQLRQQVAALQIAIDETKQRRQVAEITETDYFQSLQQRARDLRRRSTPPDGKHAGP